MQLTDSGYTPSATPPRLSVWLTNALEPAERVKSDLFWTPLAKEAEGAADVKRQTPIMCVIGNPPYSGESANKGDHIMNLMEAYKMEPGGKERLKERNPKWINDDYVKFIRMSEDVIAKNPSGGVLGFITNHGYLDNPTFRGMRWHLLKTFDKIWVLNLHGNSNRKERAPDGSADINVFGIKQGVSLIIALTRGDHSSRLAEVYRGDIWGCRPIKADFLASQSLKSVAWQKLDLHPRYYMFYPVNHGLLDQYDEGFSLKALFPLNDKGITTSRDDLAVAFSRNEMKERLRQFKDVDVEDAFLRKLFWPTRKKKDGRLPGDTASWSLSNARAALPEQFDEMIKQISYRPFDKRELVYTGIMLERPRPDLMCHVIDRANICLSTNRGIEEDRPFTDAAVFDTSIQLHSLSIKEANNLAPLYLYPDEDAAQKDALASTERTINFDPKLYAAICESAGIDPKDKAEPDDDFRAATGDARPSEVKVFDYIYGVLHSPDYRETFAEFLKINFPRIPYPASPEVFAHISEKGEALRRLHLMEPAAIGDTAYLFVGEVEDDEEANVVASGYPKFEPDFVRPEPVEGQAPRSGDPSTGSGRTGKVYVNSHQYFQNVPETAWSFYIGGYQPAQKWLKDRKGRALEYADLQHYQSIVKILLETDRIMKEIELPLETGPPEIGK